ncbi:MAG: hypothetical protein WB697_08705 [Stellaceae bacterium]
MDDVIMLVVRPNLRRMRAFINSPSECNLPGRRRFMPQVRWERAVIGACIAGAVLLGVIAVAAYY